MRICYSCDSFFDADGMQTRLYYQQDNVIVRKDDQDLIRYKHVEDLVEAHIKGLIALKANEPEKQSKLHNLYHAI